MWQVEVACRRSDDCAASCLRCRQKLSFVPGSGRMGLPMDLRRRQRRPAMRSPIVSLTTLVVVGFSVCYGAGVKADIIGNIVVTKADADHKDWEVAVTADANYTIHG